MHPRLRTTSSLLAVLCALACATGAAGRAAEREGSAIPTPHALTVDIPPRRQWNENWGYCGETSFISAGMYFGQYCSQFTARSLASPGVPQSNEESQLLLGVNEIAAAHRMRLEAVPFYERTQSTTGEYLAWVKSNVLRGHVVILGVYNNVRALDESPPGSQAYDHIVPVLGFGSQRPLERAVRRAYPTDVVTFSDNGLYGPVGDPPAFPFLFSYRLRQFPKTRSAANRRAGAVYALRRAPRNYAAAVTGIVDLDRATVPVRLTSDLDGEPDIGDGSNVPPAPVPLALTARVTIPDQRVAYNLYRYDDFAAVPAAGFNAAAGRASAVWRIPAGSGPEFTVRIATMSDATVVLRAVPESAP